MAGFTYATLTTAIQNYTEVDTNVLTATITISLLKMLKWKFLEIYLLMHIKNKK